MKLIKWVTARIKRAVTGEPALVCGLIGSGVSLAVAFGLHLSEDQVGAIMAVVAAAMGVLVRQQVTPVSKPAPNETDEPAD